jgi:hypothetical protein
MKRTKRTWDVTLTIVDNPPLATKKEVDAEIRYLLLKAGWNVKNVSARDRDFDRKHGRVE